MSATTTEDALLVTPSIVLVRRSERGPIEGRCAVPSAAETYCWKFRNPDPDAAYDFDLILTLMQKNGLMLVTESIPIANGELVIAKSSNDYYVVINDHYVKTIQAKHENFGVVTIDKVVVREYYRHFVQKYFTMKTTIQRFDASYNLVEETETDSFPFPDVPGGPLEQRERIEFNLTRARVSDRIRFSEYRLLEDGDYELDGGEAFSPREAERSIGATERSDKPPGFYVEMASQDDPWLMATLYWAIDGSGRPRFVSGVCCSQVTYDQMREWVFSEERKKSWFRTKTKLSIIRERLWIDTGQCRRVRTMEVINMAARGSKS